MNKYLLALVLLFASTPAFALFKSGDSFNEASDVNWGDIEFKFLGICICPRPPPVFYEEGEIYEYWDPSIFIDTVSMANYSAFTGSEEKKTPEESTIFWVERIRVRMRYLLPMNPPFFRHMRLFIHS